MIGGPTILQRLGAFAAQVSYRLLPANIAASVKSHALDTVGNSIAATTLDTSQMAASMAVAWGGPAEATVIGFPHILPAAASAFVNGVLAHSLDFDDTHLPSVLHPSASIIPAAFAAGEAAGSSGEEVIAAAAAGYEVCIRIGMAAYDPSLRNSIFFERGWHATSIAGTLASAAVAAKLFGLGCEGIGHAVGIAVSMASGVLEGNRTGGTVKRLHCGWAAHAGLLAAQAARAGFSAPLSALEGRFGFFRAFCDGRFNESEIVGDLGARWNVTDVFYKPYPTNHFTHAGIDAALKLRHRIAVPDIADLELGVATPVLRTIAEPADLKARPPSAYQAQFSGPFTVAAAFLGGGGLGIGLDDLTDKQVHDPRYLELAAKVRCVAAPECDDIFPNQFPAVLRARTLSGDILVEKVLFNRGGPGNPLSEEELRVKFMANAKRAIDDGAAIALADAIVTMDKRSIKDLASLMRRDR